MLFRDVYGQDSLKQKLINDVRTGKLAHAHLFVGDMGNGGLALSFAFIQYLMCENKGETDSCGECSGCRQVGRLEHPDVHFTFPTVQAISQTSDPLFTDWKAMVLENPYASLGEWIYTSDDRGRRPVISVHQSNEIVKKLTLKSFAGGYKVSVIWYAEEMNNACANKLLKIIEEPPKDTVFILLAESDDMILPTILSRTQLSRITPLSEEELVRYMKTLGDFDEDSLKSIAGTVEGNLSLAKELVKSGNVKENVNFSRFVNLMRVCYRKQVIPMMEWAEEMATLGREEQKQFLRYALYMVRQSVVRNYSENPLTHPSEEEDGFLKNFARFISGNNVVQFNELFNKAHYNVERNAHGKLLFTNITFEVMRYIHRA